MKGFVIEKNCPSGTMSRVFSLLGMAAARGLLRTGAVLFLLLLSFQPLKAQWYYAEINVLRAENRRLRAEADSLRKALALAGANVHVRNWNELEGLDGDDSLGGIEGAMSAFPKGDGNAVACRLRLAAPFLVIPFRPVMNDYIDFYSGPKRRQTVSALKRYETLLPGFRRAFEAEGVPEDLIALCIVESAVSRKARSRAGACGMWQFMETTARECGLEVSLMNDERFDVEKSTAAAARYLASLKRSLGRWDLAVLAYNCGPGRVRQAVVRAKGRDGFWDICPHLPEETQGYLLSLLAVRYLICCPDALE